MLAIESLAPGAWWGTGTTAETVTCGAAPPEKAEPKSEPAAGVAAATWLRRPSEREVPGFLASLQEMDFSACQSAGAEAEEPEGPLSGHAHVHGAGPQRHLAHASASRATGEAAAQQASRGPKPRAARSGTRD